MTSSGRIKELMESYLKNVELFSTVNKVLMRRNLQFFSVLPAARLMRFLEPRSTNKAISQRIDVLCAELKEHFQ